MARRLTNKWRTYIIKVLLPDKRVYWYGGQHKFSKDEIAKGSTYKGSGTLVNRMQHKYGDSCLKIRWLNWYDSQDSVNLAEIVLIDQLKAKHGPACINLMPGGQFAKRDRKTCSQVQKIVQNKPERKKRQSEIMINFYANGGREIISKSIRAKFRTGVWWSDPCKSKIKTLIISGHGLSAIADQLSLEYNGITPSKIKNVYYELKAELK